MSAVTGLIPGNLSPGRTGAVSAASAFKLDAICRKLKETSKDDETQDAEGDSEMVAEDTLHHNGETSGDKNENQMDVDEAYIDTEDEEKDSEHLVINEDETSMDASTENDYPNHSHLGFEPDDQTAPEFNDDEGQGFVGYSNNKGDSPSKSGRNMISTSNTPNFQVRKNKRKNFKPINILYTYESEDIEYEEGITNDYDVRVGDLVINADTNDFITERCNNASSESCSLASRGCMTSHSKSLTSLNKSGESDQPLDLSDNSCVTGKRTLLKPRRLERESTPMDLSFKHSEGESDSESNSQSSATVVDLSGKQQSGATHSGKVPDYANYSSHGACSTNLVPSEHSSLDAIQQSASMYSNMMTTFGGFLPPVPRHLQPGSHTFGPQVAGEARELSATDASAMKEYAETTMKELLGMYGFKNDLAESITKNVPIQYFASGKILETLSSKIPYPHNIFSTIHAGVHPSLISTHQPIHHCNSLSSSNPPIQPPIQLPTPPQTPHTPKSGSPPPQSQKTRGPSQEVGMTGLPSSGHQQETIFDNIIRHKVADNMVRQSNVHPTSIIGSPRMVLPQNMATMLMLAGLKEQQTAAMATNTAHHSSSVSLTPSVSIDHKSVPMPSNHHPVITTISPSLVPGSSSGGNKLVTVSPSVVPSRESNLMAGHKNTPIDYTRYVKRFSSASECGSNYCKDLNYREHFHCMDCNSRVFVKKEEMIRHFKWHKKRDESLQHGFMRYSPMDDCADRFRDCSHNRKQTHYHCLKEGCDKVYISTSDVQMHANYHRKDSAIIQEGFQRFRATEECGISYCSFFGQRTTHFHCRREGCTYTFKNKADMEKHKTYHIKDEQLHKDGFKKFMKQEACPYISCRFSRVCNHIHCIRNNCSYVLHSSGQLYSHKRKHERKEHEMQYKKFKLAQSMFKTLGGNPGLGINPVAIQALNEQMRHQGDSSLPPAIQTHVIQSPHSGNALLNASPTAGCGTPSERHTPPSSNSSPSCSSATSPTTSLKDTLPQVNFSKFASLLTGENNQIGIPPLVPSSPVSNTEMPAMDLSSDLVKGRVDDLWRKYLTHYGPNEACKPDCETYNREHFHCNAEGCDMVFRTLDNVREHGKNHDQQEQVTEALYSVVEVGQESRPCPQDCPYQNKEKHYHCGLDGCREIIVPNDKPFRRLDHYKMHEYSRKLSLTKDPMTMTLATSLDAMFKRKRGRPPKNRVIEFPSHGFPDNMPQAIFTSFKLPKPATGPPGMPYRVSPMLMSENDAPPHPLTFGGGKTTSTISVPLTGQITQNPAQPKVEVQEGFYVFQDGAPCPDQLCILYGKRHFHCIQPRCFYVTEKEDVLTMHSKDFHDNIDIPEGFVFFDRTIDCRLPSCHSNKSNRHFHCTRPNCGYSFVRYTTMAIHEQKHCEEEADMSYALTKTDLQETAVPQSNPPPSDTSETSSKNTVVKAAGTYYPLSAFPTSLPSGQVTRAEPSVVRTITSPSSSQTPSSPLQLDQSLESKDTSDEERDHGAFSTSDGSNSSFGVNGDQPVSTLLQQPSPESPHPDWTSAEQPVPYSSEQSVTYSSEQPIIYSSEQPVIYSSEQSVTYSSEQPVKFGPKHPCVRPFCKLKRRDHYHCNTCNQAFSELNRLKPHIQKHISGAISPSIIARLGDPEEDIGLPPPELAKEEHMNSTSQKNGDNSTNPVQGNYPTVTSEPPRVHPMTFAGSLASAYTLMSSQGIPLLQRGISPGFYSTAGHSGMMLAPALQASSVSSVGREFPGVSLTDKSNEEPRPLCTAGDNRRNVSEINPDTRRNRIHSSLRLLKDEPVPEGYIRFRFNEDCKYSHCGYREHQTHFHCVRTDCGYSFCDKTRFVQHTARHERLDTLMGGDFQQFRASVPCGRPDCIYTSTLGTMQNKASHFHCVKCDFVCTDTNKVVAHRRQHQKLDSIMAAGFEKFTPSQCCQIEGCLYNQKQSHYHCLKCQYAVLGLSQMSAHKYRHLESVS